MNAVVTVRMNENYELLSKKERKVADYIMDCPEKVIHESTQLIAKNSGTSTATVVRFARALGFSGLAELKRHLRLDENKASEQTGKESAEAGLNQYDVVKRETWQYNMKCIDKTFRQANDDQIKRAVRMLNQAEHVYLAATGGSASSIWCAFDSFVKLGLPCNVLFDPFFQVMAVTNDKKPETSVLLCICHSGRARDALDTVRMARERGITTIGMIGIRVSPMMQYLDIPIFTGVDENPKFSDSMTARICELNILSIIYAEISRMRGEAGINENMYRCINLKRTK